MENKFKKMNFKEKQDYLLYRIKSKMSCVVDFTTDGEIGIADLYLEDIQKIWKILKNLRVMHGQPNYNLSDLLFWYNRLL